MSLIPLTPGIQLNDETVGLINSLITIDINSTTQKNIIFKRLRELWKEEIEIGETSENKFLDNQIYIKFLIRNSLNEPERKANEIYNMLSMGNPYILSESQVIPCNHQEIVEYRRISKRVDSKVNRIFKKLAAEFDILLG